MNFTSYISISVLFHLGLALLFSMIAASYIPSQNIFDVDLIAPFEPVKQETIQKNRPVQKKTNKPVLIKKHRPPDENIKPNKLFDEYSSTEDKDTSRLALSDSAIASLEQAHKENEKKPVTELQKEDGNTRIGIDAITTIPPSALFDRKTIEKYAGKGAAQNKGLTFEAPEFKNRGYMRLLRDKIEHMWNYSGEAARMGRSGDLYIQFSIKRDGTLGKVELIRTSGYRDLDESAMRALKDAQPYWPLPEGWKEEELEINGHFIYVYGTHYLL